MPEAAPNSRKKAAILMCTYNGEKYLREQMDSFFAQSYENWELWVSDDGSKDKTRDIIREYEGRGRTITIVEGPKVKKFAANFLAVSIWHDIQADYFFWSDQDDVWFPDHLSRSIAWLETIDAEKPALYGARTIITDENGKPIGLSRLFTRPPSFTNALCQCISGGNAMAFNRAALRLLVESGQIMVDSHDWWLYLLVTGSGGVMHYDRNPVLFYRQHGKNLSGSNHSLGARWYRLWQLFAGSLRRSNDMNIPALEASKRLLNESSLASLDEFIKARQAKNWLDRMRHFFRSGVHRQTAAHTFALGVATLFNKYP